MSARSSAREERLRSILKSSKGGTYVSKRQALLKEVELRLNAKYNAIGNKTVQRVIQEQVVRFGRSHTSAKVSEQDLQNLEDSIRGLTVQESNQHPKPSCSGGKSTTGQGDQSLPNPNESESSFTTDNNVPKDTYHLFLESELVNHKLHQIAEQKTKRMKQQEMKRILDTQMEEIRLRKLQETEERRQTALQLKEEAEKYKKLEQDKLEADRKRYVRDKAWRDAQLQTRLKHKKLLQDKKRAEDKERIQQCIRELEDEEELAKLEKLEQKSYVLKVQQANEAQNILREKAKAQEWEEDKKRAAEYARRLAQEEAKRVEAFEKMKAKSNQNQQMYVLQTKARKEQEELDAQRAIEYQQQKEKADLMNEQARISKVRQDKRMMNRKLAEQVQERHEAELEEKAIAADYARLSKLRAKEAETKHVNELRLRRQKMEKQREALEAQMKEKVLGKIRDPSKMTEREQHFNSNEIETIVKNDNIVASVKERIGRMERAANTQKKNFNRGPRRTDYYS